MVLPTCERPCFRSLHPCGPDTGHGPALRLYRLSALGADGQEARAGQGQGKSQPFAGPRALVLACVLGEVSRAGIQSPSPSPLPGQLYRRG